MANDPIIKRIDAAISRLCNDLNAIYTNFFDRSTLQTSDPQVINPRRIVPIGTYACRVWQPGEDVHLICGSSNTAEIFWNYLKENLCLNEDAGLPNKSQPATIDLSASKLSRKTEASRCCLHEFADLSVKDEAGCGFYLHYAEVQKTDMDRILTDFVPRPSLQPRYGSAAWNSNMVRDIQRVACDFERFGSDSISLIYEIRRWASFHGLFGPKLGFLCTNDFVWLAHGTCVAHSKSGTIRWQESEHLLRAAIDHLKALVGSRSTSKNEQLRTIPCQTRGEELLGSNLTPEAAAAICKADSRTPSIHTDVLEEPQNAFLTVMSDFGCFLKIECECWAPMLDVRADFQENVVPRGLLRLVETMRSENTSLRIWPTPIIRSNDQTIQAWAIGIRGSEEPNLDHDYIKHVLDYDTKIGSTRVRLATRQDFKGVATSGSTIETISDDFGETVASPLNISRPRKFRTAHAAISRLRYDPRHSSVKCEVGYEDRFVDDLVWMPLEEWGGKAVEDENFIPEHRVRQLRVSKDKRVVWDRMNKVDLT